MNSIIFLIIPILLVSCKSEITSSKEILFSPEDLSLLSLENISDFWQSNSIIYKSNPTTFFNNYEGFLKGIELMDDNKHIEIDVFKSKDIAINAIEEFRQIISMYTIESSNHSIIKEKWWHMPNSFNTIFVNKYNTFIAVHYGLESEENFTQNIAVEIMKRMEQKSK